MVRKKVLHLITGLGIGGAENMLLKSLPILEKDFENRVCSIMGSKEVGFILEEKGIKVYYLEFKGWWDIFGLIYRLWKVIDDFRPNLMVTYLIHADIFGRIFGKLFGVKKIICSQRGSLLNWEWLRIVDRFTSFLVDKYIVQTNVAKRELVFKLKEDSNKFVVVPNGIDLSDYNFDINKNKKVQELGIFKDNLNIVCVSNLRIRKGHEYLLEAFDLLYRETKKINLLIVGDGDQKEKLLEQCKDYKSRKNIFFLGKRKDIREILAICNIFVLATETEGMSNAIMEAMASKLTIVTTDIEVNKELLENKKEALLISPKNVTALKKAVEFLLNHRSVSTELSKNAYLKVERKYTINRIAERLMKIYAEI